MTHCLWHGLWHSFLSLCNTLPGSNRAILGAKELYFIPQWVVRCPEKRSLNEPRGKRCQMRQKARLGVSYSHLNKHRLINALEGWIDETCLSHRNTRTGLPPKISPKLPESGGETVPPPLPPSRPPAPRARQP